MTITTHSIMEMSVSIIIEPCNAWYKITFWHTSLQVINCKRSPAYKQGHVFVVLTET